MILTCIFRPLTQEEIAQRRELARQRHAERMTADQTAVEGHTHLPLLRGTPQEDQAAGLSTGNLNLQKCIAVEQNIPDGLQIHQQILYV